MKLVAALVPLAAAVLALAHVAAASYASAYDPSPCSMRESQ